MELSPEFNYLSEDMYYLSESDVQQLRALIHLVKSGRLNPALRPYRRGPEDDEQMAPETYVVKTPASGIPALIAGVPGGTPTGTGSAGNEDMPGSAVCYFYSLLQEVENPGTGTHPLAEPGYFFASSATVFAGGSGYAVGDQLTIQGGTGTQATVLQVIEVLSGAVIDVLVITQGNYTVTPPSRASVTGGLGSGATFNVKWGASELNSLRGPYATVYNMSVTPIPSGVWILATRDKSGNWWAVTGTGSGGSGGGRVLAQVTKKTFTGGQYIKYDWKPATDTSLPVYPDFTLGSTSSLPLYDINNIDIAVPYLVYIQLGSGAYYLMEERPDWEFVKKTGPASGVYFPGQLERYSQDDKTWHDVTSVLIIDANA